MLLAVAVATIGAAWWATGTSSAAFTAQSLAQGTVRAASDWTPPTVSLASPGATVRGTVNLTVTATDADSGVKDVLVQQRPSGSSSWSTACTATSSPFTCSWSTAALASGTYELRATATDRAGNSATSDVVRTVVDNTAPTVTMTDPGSPLSGTRELAATADDAHSGIGTVAIQAQASGSTTWTTVCTVASAPFSCKVDTRTLTTDSATFSFRAVATDGAGNTATSTVVGNRVVDNVVSDVALADPGAYLTGTATLSATASSSAGVRSVTFQRAAAGGSSWTDLCTTTTSPYGCSWNTTQSTDGLYDLRAVLTDAKGRTTTSAVVGARRVHNAQLVGVDVQTVNGGVAGLPDNGDQVVYTFNRLVDTTSVLSGWNGGSTTVQTDLGTPGLLSGRSTLAVRSTALGSINLGARYHSTLFGASTTFTSTMTASTQTVDGVPVTVITVRFGSATGSSPSTVTSSTTMQWTPTSALRDVLGRAAATTTVNESGPANRGF